MEWQRHRNFKNRYKTKVKINPVDSSSIYWIEKAGCQFSHVYRTLISPPQAGKRDYYKILGVKRTATKKEISKVRNPKT